METLDGTTKQTEQITCGDIVEKTGGDYKFIGIVLTIFPKQSGEVRCVVENEDRILHIFNIKQLRKIDTSLLSSFLDIDRFADSVHENAKAHGFHDTPDEIFIKDQCNNLHAEVSELWDAHRSGTQNCFCDKATKMTELQLRPLTCREEEYADIIIRALDQMRRFKINVSEVLRIKHTYNKTRPFKHGKLN